MNANLGIALIVIFFVMAMFLTIVVNGFGGDNALFAILGYLGGSLNTIILFYFRKKPDEKK